MPDKNDIDFEEIDFEPEGEAISFEPAPEQKRGWEHVLDLIKAGAPMAGKLVSESIKPITDIRGTAEYRRLASKGLAMEALTRILEGSRRDK